MLCKCWEDEVEVIGRERINEWMEEKKKAPLTVKMVHSLGLKNLMF